MRQLTRQDFITQWAQLHSPILQHFQKVIHADDLLCACLSHLSQCEIKGQHMLFDLPPEKVLWFRPTAFLGNMHSMVSLGFSSVHLGQLFWLLLRLEFPQQNTDNGLCSCGRANDASGHHYLNFPQYAGKSWAQSGGVSSWLWEQVTWSLCGWSWCSYAQTMYSHQFTGPWQYSHLFKWTGN